MSQFGWIFPGQGAQVPKMGQDFVEKYLEAREVFEEAEEILKISLRKLVFEGGVEELTLTKNCQIAIFITSMAILRVVEKEFPEIQPSICGGLSLGEYGALCASRKGAFADLVRLVYARGMFMHEAAVKYPGTMAAVMGLDVEAIENAGYHVANINTPGQVVIAGKLDEIERAESDLKEKGARRIIRFNVAGAFHSPLMKEAEERMRPLIEKMEICESDIAFVMNVVGRIVENPDEIKKHLIAQVSSTTRWLDCVLAMEQFGVSTYFEFGPAQLAGMNKKIGAKAPTISIQQVSDLEKIYETTRK